MKLAIGLLLGGGFPVPSPFFLSYLELHTRLITGLDNPSLPKHLQVESVQLIRSQDFPIDAARNEIVRGMLKSPATHLLFLDADMTFPADLPARLLRHDTAVVTARYHMRRPPHHAVAMRYVGPDTFDCRALTSGQGLMPIDYGGAGALLIRRDVFERIAEREQASGEPVGENWFRYSRQQKPPFELRISEDMHFYRECRLAHIQPYVDWDTTCGHLSTFEVDETWNAAYQEQINARRDAMAVSQ